MSEEEPTMQKYSKKKREDLKQNRDGERNLDFLTDMVRDSGLSWAEISRRSGISLQAIDWWLNAADDIRLSRLEQVASAMGLEISLDIRISELSPLYQIDKIKAKDKIRNKPSPKTDSFMNECRRKAVRLAFLIDFIKEKTYGLSDFARICNLEITTLKMYLKNDDMRLSVLNRIAEALGTKVNMTVRKMSDTKDTEKKDG